MRWTLVFVILLVLCSSSALLSEATGIGNAVVTFTTDKGQVQVNAEVAETPSEQEQGLMFRTMLAQNAGMLFIFDQDQLLEFWMMNTSIPLDGIFISSQLQVVSVAENLHPCPPSNCQNPEYFSSGVPAMYALEVNAGFSGKNDIMPGTEVSISQLSNASATITTTATSQEQATTTISTQSLTTSAAHVSTTMTTTTMSQEQVTATISTQELPTSVAQVTAATASVGPSSGIGFAFLVIAIGAGAASAAGGLALAMTGGPYSEIFTYRGYYYCRMHRVPVWYVQGRPWCPVERRFLI
jgi:uncharacterized membrane protein (UPF0127 family)